MIMALLLHLIQLFFKEKIMCQTDDNDTNDVEIIVTLKYLSNSWRTLEMPLINCETNLILSWSANCVAVTIAVAKKVQSLQ